MKHGRSGTAHRDGAGRRRHLRLSISDRESGRSLATRSRRSSFDAEMAGGLDADVIKAKLSATKGLGISQVIEDIPTSLDVQYHPMRLVPGTSLFVRSAPDRGRGDRTAVMGGA